MSLIAPQLKSAGIRFISERPLHRAAPAIVSSVHAAAEHSRRPRFFCTKAQITKHLGLQIPVPCSAPAPIAAPPTPLVVAALDLAATAAVAPVVAVAERKTILPSTPVPVARITLEEDTPKSLVIVTKIAAVIDEAVIRCSLPSNRSNPTNVKRNIRKPVAPLASEPFVAHSTTPIPTTMMLDATIARMGYLSIVEQLVFPTIASAFHLAPRSHRSSPVVADSPPSDVRPIISTSISTAPVKLEDVESSVVDSVPTFDIAIEPVSLDDEDPTLSYYASQVPKAIAGTTQAIAQVFVAPSISSRSSTEPNVCFGNVVGKSNSLASALPPTVSSKTKRKAIWYPPEGKFILYRNLRQAH